MTTRPATVNFHLYIGATFSERITLRDANETPMDLAGFTARMQVRKELDDTATQFELTTENGGITLNAEPGTVDLVYDFDVTTALEISDDFEVWIYDLLITDPAQTPDVVDRMIKGTITVWKGVTRG